MATTTFTPSRLCSLLFDRRHPDSPLAWQVHESVHEGAGRPISAAPEMPIDAATAPTDRSTEVEPPLPFPMSPRPRSRWTRDR